VRATVPRLPPIEQVTGRAETAHNVREEVRATFHFDDVISFCNAVKLSLPDGDYSSGVPTRRPSARAMFSGVNPLADSRWRRGLGPRLGTDPSAAVDGS
jgi:hypothetical protein